MIYTIKPSEDTLFEVEGISLIGVGVENEDEEHRETARIFDLQYGCQVLNMRVFKREADVYWNDGKRTKILIEGQQDARLIFHLIQKWRSYFLWHLEEEFKKYIKRVYSSVEMKRVDDTIDEVWRPVFGMYDVWPRGQQRKDGSENLIHFKLVAGFHFWEPKTISRFEVGGVKKHLDQSLSRAFFDEIEATAIQTGLSMKRVLSA